MAEIINLFPLSIYKAELDIDGAYRDRLVDEILEMGSSEITKKPGKAWTGDVNGFEFLHKLESFEDLFRRLANPLLGYLDSIGIESSKLDLFYTRSWATISRRGENILPHSHMQSQISFAYYLKKPKNSGGLAFFDDDPPNQFAGNLFSVLMFENGILRTQEVFNVKSAVLDSEEDGVVIFPSKTRHGTQPNETEDVRISISADIVVTLKERVSVEYLMPAIGEWGKVEPY